MTRAADVEESVDAFRRILRALRRAARRTELTTGLSAAQLFVLTTVDSAPGSSMNDIAAATMTDRSSVAAIVDRLVELRHVTREQAAHDRRRAQISITARGRRAIADAAPAPTMLLIAGLQSLPPAPLRALAQSLTMLTHHMGIATEPAEMLFEDSNAHPPAQRTPRQRRPIAR